MKFLYTLLFFISSIAFGQNAKLIALSPSGSAGSGKLIPLGYISAPPPLGAIKITLPGDFNQAGINVYFNIDKACNTSAGVFSADGNLLKTLWSNKPLPFAATYSFLWDGTDDRGNLIDDGNYVVKILTNNVGYTWLGVIGNTSDSTTGTSVHHGYTGIFSMCIAGNVAYIAKDYNEANTATIKINLSAIGKKIDIFSNNGNNNTSMDALFAVTDSVKAYYGGFDPFSSTKSFVVAVNVGTDAESIFSSGVSYHCAVGRTYNSAINLVTSSLGKPTGMAVQKTGNYLFVSRAGLNRIDVVNKTTGAVAQTLTFTNAGALCIDRNDNLWVAFGSPRAIQKFTVNSDGTLTGTPTSITGLVAVLGMDVSPDNSTITICDGGTSQQLKSFSTSTGSSSWTFGTAGGYQSDATVANNKFYFTDSSGVDITGWITYAPDGTMWVGDGGNNRALHLAADRTFIEKLMFLGNSYSCTVDANDSSRVFSDFKEFHVDWTKTIDNGSNGSWTLVKNWGANIVTKYADQYNRFKSVATLSNGHTYALIRNTTPSSIEVFELMPSGTLRATGITGLSTFTRMNADGSLRDVSAYVNGQPFTFTSQPLTGFDGSNNPIWGPAVTITTTPAVTINDPSTSVRNTLSGRPGLITSSNYQIVWDGSTPLTNYPAAHIGAVKVGSNTKWLWRTAWQTSTFYNGPFPSNGDYDIGNGTNNAGGIAAVKGRNIFWSFHGEGWKGSQVNKFIHLWDNGLVLGIFGVTGNDAGIKGVEAAPGMAGNALFWAIVKISDSVYYLVHCDESYHSGVHVWKIYNLNTINEITIPISIFTNPNGLRATYMDSTDLNNAPSSVKTIRRDAQINFDWGSLVPSGTAITDHNNFSARWEGFVKADYTEAYTFYSTAPGSVRLWVDSLPLVDQWDNVSSAEYSGSINLVAGKKYYIRMEIAGASGSVYLKYSSASTTKQFIPQSKLYPYLPENTGTLNLMEGIWFNKEWTQQLYGWQRNPPGADLTNKNTQFWSVLTGYATYQKQFPTDFKVTFVESVTPSVYTLSRDLGTQNVTNSWEIQANVNYNGTNFNDGTKYGQYVQVLDASGKVLARFYMNQPALAGNVSIIGNTQTITSDTKANVQLISNYFKPLDIKCVNGTVTITYDSFNSVSDAIFDGTGDWHHPKTFQIYEYHVSSSTNVPRIINLKTPTYTSN